MKSMMKFLCVFGVLLSTIIIIACPTSTDDSGGSGGNTGENIGQSQFDAEADVEVIPDGGLPSWVNHELLLLGEDTVDYKNIKDGDATKLLDFDVEEGAVATSKKSLKIDFSLLLSGWVGLQLPTKAKIDASNKNALSFFIKRTSDEGVLEKIISPLGDGFAVNGYDFGGDKESGKEWKQVTIPFYNTDVLKEIEFALQAIQSYKDGVANPIVIIDEIRFQNLDTLPIPQGITVPDDSLNLALVAGTGIDIPPLKLNFDGYVIDHTHVAGQVVWVSSDETIVSIGDEKITALAEGTATLSPSVGGQEFTDAKIEVTVTAPVQDTKETRFYIYGDEEGINTDAFNASTWDYYGGYDGTIAHEERKEGGADSSAKFLALTGNAKGWAAGGWGRKAGDASSLIDIASCSSLVFSAKVPETAGAGKTIATSIRWGMQDDDGDPEFGHEIVVDTPALTTEWQKYAIPLTGFVTGNINLTRVITVKYALVKTTDQVDIDEVYIANCADAVVTAPVVTPDSVIPARANFYVYGDTADADADSTVDGVQTDLAIQEWTYTPSWANTITVDELESGGATSSAKHFKLTGTGAQDWAAGGWQTGGKAPLDLSKCDNLVFYAKSELEAGSKISFAIESADAGNGGVEQAITKDWAEYSLTMTSLLAVQVAIDVKAITTVKYVLASNKDVVYIDEVRFTGCDKEGGTIDPNPSTDTKDTRFYIYGDETGINTDAFNASTWDYYGGYEGTIAHVEREAGGADSSAKYLALTGTAAQAWAAGGWGRTGVDNSSLIDIASCTNLVFSAKVPETAGAGKTVATSIKWGIDAISGDERKGKEVIVTTPALTTAWQKYAIPLTDFSAAGINLAQVVTVKYVLSSKTNQIDIDEVYIANCADAEVTPPDSIIPARANFYVYGDTTAADADSTTDGVQTDLSALGWAYTPGWANTVVSEELRSGGASSSAKNLKLTGTGAEAWAAGGWQTSGEAPLDLSKCDNLVFYAKSPAATLNIAIESAGAGNGGVAREITNEWIKYTLSMTDLLAAQTAIDVKAITTIKYVLGHKEAVVYIDEVRFTGCDS